MTHYRSLFLSDFHMGAKSFDAPALLDFLKRHDADYIYLVGDIFDGWKLAKRWHWSESCSDILDEILRKQDQGSKIIYLPGNHDDEIRHALPILRLRYGKRLGVRLKDTCVHKMADGRKFLVLHGDQFDRKILRGPLSQWSDKIYDFVMDILNAHGSPAKVKIKGKVKKFSLAKSLSKHGQWALYLLNNFENAVYKRVKREGLDGLICGHTHIPVIKNIRDITYANSGCWLRSGHTALVETYGGELELIDWPASSEQMPKLFDMAPVVALNADARGYRPTTKKIIRALQRIWSIRRKDKKLGVEWVEITSRNKASLRAFHGLLSVRMSPDQAQKGLTGERRISISRQYYAGDYRLEMLSGFDPFAQIPSPHKNKEQAYG